MPEKKTIQRARKDKRQGKAPTTQAGEFVREEMEHVREGKHGVKNPKQAIAIGLSKARRAGVKLAPPKRGKASAATRKKAERDLEAGGRTTTRRSSAKKTAAAARKRASTKTTTKRAAPRTSAAKRTAAKSGSAKRAKAAGRGTRKTASRSR